ncbi:uncharacterized protein ASCRUDRAFT_131859 [Ascoidea rubescens DSM 1968]|uniref:Uncharacterized protein n=1 Tax=Ascoidea rubescens DSM 1968 TaxID=1344418 RepID=A0A1D2V8C0_9ASCO|nr:hypothetical protein ASCRUDRAFT_131859 [Ascoidea rubescens DSM 1968]ODV57892.1 hypothetical protein ASCRUDRAFT_131859 [Ascoidea rubescens DSM 1968]
MSLARFHHKTSIVDVCPLLLRLGGEQYQISARSSISEIKYQRDQVSAIGVCD